MTTDKGLKKAIKSQPAYRLPSNFTYRMMQQVREEAYARERREEFRLRLALVVFCVCALGGLFYYIIKVYGVMCLGWSFLLYNKGVWRCPEPYVASPVPKFAFA